MSSLQWILLPTHMSLVPFERFFHTSPLSPKFLCLLVPCAHSQPVTLLLIPVRKQQQLDENVYIPMGYPLLPAPSYLSIFPKLGF